MNPVHIVEGASDADIAHWLELRIAAALARTPEGIAITVPGGSTPFPILERLAGSRIDWTRLTVWPGDDRIVPEDHPASNIGRIRAVLEPAGARIAALAQDATPPHFAVAWLGMGGDGHIASLFPSADPRADDPLRVRRLTPDPLPPEAPFDRLSLTIPALLDCDELLFVIRGADKRALFETAARSGGDGGPASLPPSSLPIARLLAAATMPVTCFT